MVNNIIIYLYINTENVIYPAKEEGIVEACIRLEFEHPFESSDDIDTIYKVASAFEQFRQSKGNSCQFGGYMTILRYAPKKIIGCINQLNHSWCNPSTNILTTAIKKNK